MYVYHVIKTRKILRIKRGMEHAGQAKANLDEEIRKLSTRYNTFVNISLSKVLFVSNNAILIFRRWSKTWSANVFAAIK